MYAAFLELHRAKRQEAKHALKHREQIASGSQEHSLLPQEKADIDTPWNFGNPEFPLDPVIVEDSELCRHAGKAMNEPVESLDNDFIIDEGDCEALHPGSCDSLYSCRQRFPCNVCRHGFSGIIKKIEDNIKVINKFVRGRGADAHSCMILLRFSGKDFELQQPQPVQDICRFKPESNHVHVLLVLSVMRPMYQIWALCSMEESATECELKFPYSVRIQGSKSVLSGLWSSVQFVTTAELFSSLFAHAANWTCEELTYTMVSLDRMQITGSGELSVQLVQKKARKTNVGSQDPLADLQSEVRGCYRGSRTDSQLYFFIICNF